MNIIPLEPIKAIYPNLNWRDNIGNGMAIGDSPEINLIVSPDQTVRLLFGNLDEPVYKLLTHLTGNEAGAREYLEKSLAEADKWPLLPCHGSIGEIGARMLRRVGVETQFHELYVTLPKAGAAGTQGK